MLAALLGSVVLITAPAVLPVVALLGLRPVVLLLLLPVGGLMAALAATGAVGVGGSIFPWFVGLVVVVNAFALACLRRRPDGQGSWVQRGTVLLVALATVLPLIALRRPILDWDARSIWLLHARLLTGGHDAYVSALTNPAYDFSHVTYPPLLPGAIALAWKVRGEFDYRLAQFLVAMFNASAAALLGWTVAQVYGLRRSGRWQVLAVAPLVTLATFGVVGAGASNGYADMFAAVAACSGVVAGLVLPRSRQALLVAVLSLWCAGSTKNEALLGAALLLMLVAVRYYRGWALMVRLALLPAPLAAWPLAVAVHGGRITEISSTPVVHQATAFRLDETATALASQLGILPAVMVTSVAAWLLCRSSRNSLGLASPLWLWAAFTAGLGTLVATYVAGPLEIRFWLNTSVGRTAMYPRLLLLSELAVSLLVALMPTASRRGIGARRRPGRPPSSAGRHRRVPVGGPHRLRGLHRLEGEGSRAAPVSAVLLTRGEMPAGPRHRRAERSSPLRTDLRERRPGPEADMVIEIGEAAPAACEEVDSDALAATRAASAAGTATR